MVTLTFTTDDPIQTPTVVFTSNGAAVAGGVTYNNPANKRSWTAQYTTQNGDTEGGVVGYTIDFTNLAGTDGTDVNSGHATNVTFDKTAPNITAVGIASNNAAPGPTTHAKVGHVVTLTFTTNEAIQTPTVVFTSNGAAVAGGVTYNNPANKRSWTAQYTTQNGDTEGTVVGYTIDFNDLAGNNNGAVVTSGHATNVTFDKTAPNITAVGIASNNAAPGPTTHAKVGHVVTLTFTTNEANTDPQQSYLPPMVRLLPVASPTTTLLIKGVGLAQYTTQNGDTEGTVVGYTIDFNDLAGNNNGAVVTSGHATNVTFDKTAPNITAVGIASNNAAPGPTTHAKVGHVVTLTFTTNEEIRTPTVVFTSNGAAVAGGVTYNNPANKKSWTAQYTTQNGDTEGGVVGYTIDFNDLAGNNNGAVVTSGHATNVTFDKTAPTVGTVSIVSSQSPPTLAKVGDMITLTFVTNEKIQTPTVVFKSNGQTVAGANTPTSTGGNKRNWTTSYVTQPGDTHGNVTFTITFKDLASNDGITESTVDDASSVLFDKTFPWLIDVGISSNNPTSNSWATSPNTITLNFKASEPIFAPTVTFNAGGTPVNGANTPTNPSGNKLNWTTSYVADAGDAGGTSGPVTFSVAFSDLASNTGTADTTVDDASSVTFDMTPPILTFVGIASNNIPNTLVSPDGVVTVAFTVDEPISEQLLQVAFLSGSANINDASITYLNVSGDKKNWTAAYTADQLDTAGLVTFTIGFTSLAGIAGTDVTSVNNGSSVTFKKSAPTITSASIASDNGTSTRAIVDDDVTLTFTASEKIRTPVVTFRSGGQPVAGVVTYNDPADKRNWTAKYTAAGGDTDGNVTFTINFEDISGNPGIPVTSGSGSVTFDNTSPTPANVSISSDNAISSNFLGVGQPLVILLKSSLTLMKQFPNQQ